MVLILFFRMQEPNLDDLTKVLFVCPLPEHACIFLEIDFCPSTCLQPQGPWRNARTVIINVK